MVDTEEGRQVELSVVDSLLMQDLRNNSAWNHRWFVVHSALGSAGTLSDEVWARDSPTLRDSSGCRGIVLFLMDKCVVRNRSIAHRARPLAPSLLLVRLKNCGSGATRRIQRTSLFGT